MYILYDFILTMYWCVFEKYCLFQEEKTALHYATLYVNTSVVETLIKLEADLNAADEVS